MARYPNGPRVKVNVTRELITEATRVNSGRCWIAEAIKAAYPNATHVAVDVATCRFSDLDKGHRYVYLTPYSAQLALLQFDEGKNPEPFSMLLKNAHVTRAGIPDKNHGTGHNRRGVPNVPKKATLAPRGSQMSTSQKLPSRIGGRRPPQLRMLRHFGLRAYRGASTEALHAAAKATRPE